MFKTWWEDLKRIPYFDAQWIALWVLIYAGFIFLDIFMPGWPGTNLIKYTGIFLCVAYAYTKYHNDAMLILALAFTFLADTILVWTSWVVAGVYIFCFAQFMHLLRLTKAKMEYIFAWTSIVSIAFGIAIIYGLEPIYAISSIYAIILCSNLATAHTRYRTHKDDFKARCAFYGFVAFICCDCCVAMRFLALDNILPVAILPVVNFLVWVFYYPSQVLIANSSTTEKTFKIAKSLRK